MLNVIVAGPVQSQVAGPLALSTQCNVCEGPGNLDASALSSNCHCNFWEG